MSELVKELRAYPAHYTAAHKAADRLDALEKALLDVVVWAEELGLYADAGTVLAPVFVNTRAVLEEKNG